MRFVHPEGEKGFNSPWDIQFTLKNFGQTPAYFTRLVVEKKVRPPLKENDILTLSNAAMSFGGFTLPPGHFHTVQFPNCIGGVIEARHNNGSGLYAYIWGQADYLDVFGKERWIKFQMVHFFGRVYEFSFCNVGNECDSLPDSLSKKED